MISLDSHRTASGLVDHVNVTESHLPLYGSESHANGFDPWSGTTYRPLRVRRSGWSTGLRGRPYGDMKKPAEFNTPQNPAQRVMYSAGFSFPHTPTGNTSGRSHDVMRLRCPAHRVAPVERIMLFGLILSRRGREERSCVSLVVSGELSHDHLADLFRDRFNHRDHFGMDLATPECASASTIITVHIDHAMRVPPAIMAHRVEGYL